MEYDMKLTMDMTLCWFDCAHLPEHLFKVTVPFQKLAADMVIMAPNDPETLIGLRKLLEAKDCAVRAAIRAREHGNS
jgi:hypothetical protein